ncbi:hypothetical protein F2Q69_00035128 [Brassica cretica]|uniref:Uncharacterized protein n=1 Tax=Brassica cretica TaxID=69181 RepID=A0A8S9SP73_BRACR|nr:hypothetical protein F2Q69_00035128 [Brassica cretica]
MMGPKRTKAASRIKPPYARGEPEDYSVPPTYPWPREEGTEIFLTIRTSLSLRRQDGIRKPRAATTLCSTPTSSQHDSSTPGL